jgi:hypothetical protein
VRFASALNNHQRNPAIRPIFGTVLVLLLGYFDWTLYQKLLMARVFESGEKTRQRMEAQIAIVTHQADIAEAKADALALKPGKGADADRLSPVAKATQRLAAEVRSDLIGAWIDRVYGSFFQTLSLSPADLERFKGLIREKRQNILDAIDAAQAQGMTDQAALRSAILTAIGPVNTDTENLLGPLDYASFRAYQASLPARSTVDELAAALPAGAALTSDQSNALVAALARNQPAAERASSVVQNLLVNVPAAVTPKDLTAAEAVLTPAQLNVLQNLATQQGIQRDLLRLLYP